MTSHRAQWESPRDYPAWSDFHRTHWGAAGRRLLDQILGSPPLERFLGGVPAVVLRKLGVPVIRTGSSPSVLLREEILLFYERFRNARDPRQGLEGVVLMGQSGIGKTVLLILFLVQCMSLEEPALFTTRSGTTYLFDERGVVILNLKTSDFSAAEHLPHRDGHAPRPWSLVDCPRERAPPPSSVTLDARPHMFFITTLSPDKSRHTPYEHEHSIRTWWMSRWSDDELIAILQRAPPDLLHPLHQERCSTFDAEAVRFLRAAAGAVPGDILYYLVDPLEYNTQVTEETGPYALDPVLALVSGAEACAFSNELCGRATFVGRAGPTFAASDLGDDTFAVTFKTRAALQRVLDALEWRPAELLRGVYERCRHRDRDRARVDSMSASSLRLSRHPGPRPNSEPVQGGFADFLFEGIARQYMYAAFKFEFESSLPDPGSPDADGACALSRLVQSSGENLELEHQFARMALPPGARSTTRFAFRQDKADAHHRTLTAIVDKGRQITWRQSNAISEPSSSSPSTSPHAQDQNRDVTAREPWAPRRRVTFREQAQLGRDIPINAATCYSPSASATTYPRALFDLFFFQAATDPAQLGVVLWAVQVASRREDVRADDDAGGYEVVARLREAWPGEGPVEVKYALVVPCDRAMAFDVEWELGEGFGEHEGEVYVQYVDVCGVCRVEDVFGVPVPS